MKSETQNSGSWSVNVLAISLTAFVLTGFLSGCLGEGDDGTVPYDPTDTEGTQVDMVEVDFTYTDLPYVGVNLTSAEWGFSHTGVYEAGGDYPGVAGAGYVWPSPKWGGYHSLNYFIEMGMTTFRVPFRWERIQRTLGGDFDETELQMMTDTIYGITAHKAYAILDPHNYARYNEDLIGEGAVTVAHYADLWSRLAKEVKDDDHVIFGLMNEPVDILPNDWVVAANAAIKAIRDTGATNLILVPGTGWDGAHSWAATWYGAPGNAVAMLDIVDPGDNFAFEAHQYLNDSSSGAWDGCTSETIGSDRMQGFTDWLRENNFKGFLGEFGVEDTPTCLTALDDQLDHVLENSDVYIGWTWWAAGPMSSDFTRVLDPAHGGGADTPQGEVIARHLDSYQTE